MSKKTIVLLVGALLLALAVYAGGQKVNVPTNDVSITNAEVAETGIICPDCDENCEDCEGCDGKCEDCGNCDMPCKGHRKARMCGGHDEGGNGCWSGGCGGHGNGI